MMSQSNISDRLEIVESALDGMTTRVNRLTERFATRDRTRAAIMARLLGKEITVEQAVLEMGAADK